MRITFRRWGKLEAVGEARLAPLRTTRRLERLDRAVSTLVDLPGLGYRARRRATTAWNRVKYRLHRRTLSWQFPELLLIEAISHESQHVAFTVTIKSTESAETGLFQENIDLAPGYNRVCIPANSIFGSLDPSCPFVIQIEPVSSDAQMTVTFGIIDFVSLRGGAQLLPLPQMIVAQKELARREVATDQVAGRAAVAATVRPADISQLPKAKCVIWDLDNTIWRGTLVEDGPKHLQLNATVAAAIVELDRRGILHSIASKNSREEAEPVLRQFGLWEYFLAPQINWDPKSSSIGAIAAALNMGKDTFLFIDDQAFERHEVQAVHPEVEALDITAINTLLDHPRLDVPITREAERRRFMYREEEARETAMRSSSGAFLTFLKNCNLKLTIDDLNLTNLNRVFELTERTNQLNYAASRISRSHLEAAMMRTSRHRGLVLSASDRFGDYGIIGFALLEPIRWSIESFFMSCRVQRKRVDHAFFGYLLALGAQRGKKRLSVNYRQTKRNSPSFEVLEQQMMFHSGDEHDGVQVFHHETADVIPESDIVTVDDHSTITLPEIVMVGSAHAV